MISTESHKALSGRQILLGVTGGIAAYKAAELARLMMKAGADIRVVMTASATEFVGVATFQAITGHAVRTELFDAEHEAAMGHIELARWADLVLVAPATADFVARLAQGRADDLLATLCLATTAPVVLAPAMNQAMWAKPATRDNVAVLNERGIRCWGPVSGEQACGDIGPGRMMEPIDIASRASAFLNSGRFNGIHVLITAGPTQEPVDPVRFIGNRSSGKMGYALAEQFARDGATVSLVSGPVALNTPGRVKRHKVRTALEMHDQVMRLAPSADIFVACAAVADYRPAEVSGKKLKKSAERMQIDLVRNPDVLADVSSQYPEIFSVGFAAESHALEDHASKKREAKAVDMIAANPVTKPGQGFESDNNELLVLWEGGSKQLPRQAKSSLAGELVKLIADRFYAQAGTESTGSTTGG
ncbi:MAG: bifunctional phosphopantothenoylcysteine decarboxylase/phosphopantothenate--cysteine ligase CoaBC [bacterium]